MTSGGASLQPTFNGHVATTQDALLLFEACLQGHLSHVPRRPHDRERSALIRSGSVFIYEENASGIKRWTDGVLWSPSRILGNFLVYRELDKPFPPGQKKKAFQKNKRRPSRPGEPYPRADGESYSPVGSQSSFSGERSIPDEERSLIGSLIDSYEFKTDGLVKKTMSVTVQGVTHHLVSYYNVSDVLANNLRTPSSTDTLQYVRPRMELTQKQSFRAPIDETEDMEAMRGGQQPGYNYRMGAPGGYMPHQPYMQAPYGYMPPAPPPGGGYGMPLPSMAPPYLQSQLPPAPSGPTRAMEYNPYQQSPYNRSYESLHHGQPSPVSTTPTSRSMHEHSQQPPYPSHPPGPPMENRGHPSYSRGSYGVPPESGADVRGQAGPPQQSDPRDSHNPAQSGYPNPRPSYYPESSERPPVSYQGSPTVPPWPSQPHPQ